MRLALDHVPSSSRNRSSSAWQAAGVSAATRWIAQLRSTSRMTPSALEDRLGQIALLVLDDRELARLVDERGIGRQALVEALAEPLAGQPAALLEDLVDEVLAADRADGGEQARWPARRSWSGRGPGRPSVTSYTWRGRPTP